MWRATLWGMSELEAVKVDTTGQTVPTRFLATVAAHGEVPALRDLRGEHAGGVTTWTYAEYAQQVAVIAAGLAALGVGAGDRVVIMMRNRPEFHFVDAAALFLGATPFSLYTSASPEEVAYAVDHASAGVAVVEDLGFLERFSVARQHAPALRHIVV